MMNSSNVVPWVVGMVRLEEVGVIASVEEWVEMLNAVRSGGAF